MAIFNSYVKLPEGTTIFIHKHIISIIETKTGGLWELITWDAAGPWAICFAGKLPDP